MGLSITIITLNEEKNLERALRSALFADEIILVDSGSQDRTLEIAKRFGPKVKILENSFDGYGEQKNFASDLCTHNWVFSLDADEEISPELRSSIQEIVAQTQPSSVIWQCRRLTNYCGHWVRHGGWYPDLQERLYRRDSARWTTPRVHERLRVLDAKNQFTDTLNGDLLHYSFHSYRDQLVTNTNFSLKAAHDYITKNPAGPSWVSMAFRPLWKFIEAYILKLGFFDGTIGFFIAINSAHAMFSKLAQAYLIKRGRL